MADNSEVPVRPAETEAEANADQDQQLSKNALKKAAKAEKASAEKADKKKKTKDASQGAAKPAGAGASKKKIEGAALIGIDVAKEDDFAGWYQQVLLKGDMLDYYDVSGCFVLKVCLVDQLTLM